jgi:hypothetical protein
MLDDTGGLAHLNCSALLHSFAGSAIGLSVTDAWGSAIVGDEQLYATATGLATNPDFCRARCRGRVSQGP